MFSQFASWSLVSIYRHFEEKYSKFTSMCWGWIDGAFIKKVKIVNFYNIFFLKEPYLSKIITAKYDYLRFNICVINFNAPLFCCSDFWNFCEIFKDFSKILYPYSIPIIFSLKRCYKKVFIFQVTRGRSVSSRFISWVDGYFGQL